MFCPFAFCLPYVLYEAENTEFSCAMSAILSADVLFQHGYSPRIVTVKLHRENIEHVFTSVEIKGKWYAVDNGALPACSKVCSLTDALKEVEFISDKPYVEDNDPIGQDQ